MNHSRKNKNISASVLTMIALLLVFVILLIALITAVVSRANRDDRVPSVSTMDSNESRPDPSETVDPGSDSSTGTLPPEVTSAPPDESEPPESNTVTMPPETAPQDTDTDSSTVETDPPTTGALDEISKLPNKTVGWGFGNHLDEDNRPIYSITEQNKFGKYDADYIRDPEGDYVYLTFDCGYENGITGRILDTLKEKNAKGVFFITMDYARSEPELVQRMIDEGHIVGNHSLTHPAAGLPSLSLEKQIDELMVLHDYVYDNFGYTMKLFRYPAGIYSEQSLALVQSLGYRAVFWSYAYADWDPANQPDPEASLEKLTGRLHAGAIYLLHAVSDTNATILGDLIDNARAKGYIIADSYYDTNA